MLLTVQTTQPKHARQQSQQDHRWQRCLQPSFIRPADHRPRGAHQAQASRSPARGSIRRSDACQIAIFTTYSAVYAGMYTAAAAPTACACCLVAGEAADTRRSMRDARIYHTWYRIPHHVVMNRLFFRELPGMIQMVRTAGLCGLNFGPMLVWWTRLLECSNYGSSSTSLVCSSVSRENREWNFKTTATGRRQDPRNIVEV